MTKFSRTNNNSIPTPRTKPIKGEPGWEAYREQIRNRRNAKRNARAEKAIKNAIQKSIETGQPVDLKLYGPVGKIMKQKLWSSFADFMLSDGLNLYVNSLKNIGKSKEQCEEIRKMLDFFKPKLSAVAFLDQDGLINVPIPDEKQRERLKKIL